VSTKSLASFDTQDEHRVVAPGEHAVTSRVRVPATEALAARAVAVVARVVLALLCALDPNLVIAHNSQAVTASSGVPAMHALAGGEAVGPECLTLLLGDPDVVVALHNGTPSHQVLVVPRQALAAVVAVYPPNLTRLLGGHVNRVVAVHNFAAAVVGRVPAIDAFAAGSTVVSGVLALLSFCNVYPVPTNRGQAALIVGRAVRWVARAGGRIAVSAASFTRLSFADEIAVPALYLEAVAIAGLVQARITGTVGTAASAECLALLGIDIEPVVTLDVVAALVVG
jgi:hypothetical protein